MEKIMARQTAKENPLREGKLGILKETKRVPLNNVANKIDLKKDDNKKPEKSKPILNPIKLTKQSTVKELINKTDNLLIKKETKPLVSSYSSKQMIGILDVDEHETDPMLVAEYIKDIMGYLMGLEEKYQVSKNFLQNKHLTNPRMRSVVVNWMAEVCYNFKFLIETYQLSISILDRYLEKNRKVGKETLQLVGATALLIAAKYEEMFIPDIEDFVFICDNLYTKRQILKMEFDILKRLDFGLGKPLAIHFLRRYSRVIKATPQHHVLGKYLTELAVLYYNICHVKASLIAAASSCLSICLLNDVENPEKIWTPVVRHYTTYKFSDIKEIVGELCNMLIKVETSKHQSIRSRYASSDVGRISASPKLRGTLVQKFVNLYLPQKK